ncbi:MAG: lipase maturation factor family protein [Gemmatimonadota bacterium]
MSALADVQTVLTAAESLFGRVVGTAGGAGSYTFARWIFLRSLGAVFLVAFLSLWVQVEGLLGEDGVLPAGEYLDTLRVRSEGVDLVRAPTIFWWAGGDGALHAACAAGTALSLALAVGLAPPLALAGLWALYLSFAAVGRVFLSYQWDVLLLEASFLGIFLAPWGLATGPLSAAPDPAVPAAALFAAWWLLFRLVFQSGVGKLTSGDPAWRDLSALEYHWWTQPLPTWTAWWAARLPRWCHRAATAATHVLEIAVPLMIFGPREIRIAGFAGIVLLQVVIALTGNYNFFNLLTVALAFLLLDDAAWAGLLGDGAVAVATEGAAAPAVQSAAAAAVAVGSLAASLPHVWRTLFPDRPLPAVVQAATRRLAPFRTINSYGLFRVMTRRRPEIVVEGSRDGETWRPYRFRWKPCDPRRKPRFCAPHQPRLDWQMWFAALSTFRRSRWMHAFLVRLLEGSRAVEALLEEVPYPEEGPTYVRAVLYEYRFADPDERRRSGRWWTRERVGLYAPPVTAEG